MDLTGCDNKSRHIIVELNAGKRPRVQRSEYYVNSENFISNVNHRSRAYGRAIWLSKCFFSLHTRSRITFTIYSMDKRVFKKRHRV